MVEEKFLSICQVKDSNVVVLKRIDSYIYFEKPKNEILRIVDIELINIKVLTENYDFLLIL